MSNAGLIALLCGKRKTEDRAEIIAANSIGVTDLSDIILSRSRLPFLDELCEARGIIGEQVIFQTKDDLSKRKNSILGEGGHPIERKLYWILGAI